MDIQSDQVKVFGKRVLVEKERLDAGGIRLTPIQEEDGKKNSGKIVAIGSARIIDRLRGIRVGQTVWFRKFFVANDGQSDSLVFVDIENITGIRK